MVPLLLLQGVLLPRLVLPEWLWLRRQPAVLLQAPLLPSLHRLQQGLGFRLLEALILRPLFRQGRLQLALVFQPVLKKNHLRQPNPALELLLPKALLRLPPLQRLAFLGWRHNHLSRGEVET